MIITALSNLRSGDKFIWDNKWYTVYIQEGMMTEVFGNGRFWAWPSCVRVKYVAGYQDVRGYQYR